MYFVIPGRVKCEVYYNSHYVSSGDADSVIQLSVQAAGARHVIIEPRTVAVPYGHTVQLRCTYENADDDGGGGGGYYGTASEAAVSWRWLINGHQLNSTGQYCWCYIHITASAASATSSITDLSHTQVCYCYHVAVSVSPEPAINSGPCADADDADDAVITYRPTHVGQVQNVTHATCQLLLR